MNINFPAEQPPRTPENPEADFEKKKAVALRAILKISPKEDLDELHTVTPEGSETNGNTLFFRRPPDLDRYKEETFFEVAFNESGEAVAHELLPKDQSFDDVLKRGRKAV